MKNDKEVMRLGKARRGEEQITSKTGKVFTFMVIKVPLRDEDGNIIGTVGNSIDITNQKKAEKDLIKAKEQAEEANLSKANFLATVSHELRTPLNGILGISDILSRETLSPSQKELIKDIQTSGKNLLELVNDILDFSKLEIGKMVLEVKPFNPKKLVQDIIANIMHQIANKEIKILAKYDAEVPDEVLGDQLRTMQILVNLIGNSIKFTEKGHIKIKVVLTSKTNNRAVIDFVIQDTGIGIPKNKLNKIFDRFMQVEAKYNRRFGGVGLGLSICKQLVEMMEGDISVRSKLNRGSEFKVTIPFYLAVMDNAKTIANAENIREKESLFKYYVLIVEDEPINQKIMSLMLKEFGCHFDLAEKGTDALSLIEKNDYDIVFTDIGLPDINGILLTQRIRKMKKKRLPIIATTAYALKKDIQCFNKIGLNGVLTKPIEREALRKMLEKWG
jgi:signal transduction histidine kinase